MHRGNMTRVLVAEDDDDMRELIIQGLEGPDRRVIPAEDGFELLDYLALCTPNGNLPLPDLIVTDFNMPGRDALDVLEKTRALGVRVPVVVITGHTDPGLKERARALGAELVLNKPFELDVLKGHVSRLLGVKT
jgi:CheY-like chemotaxis protein